MKALLVLLLTSLLVAIGGLVWQGRTIAKLRAEVAELRRDLQFALGTALEKPALSESEQARREQLELIKLRHEVRQLKQDLVDAHAGDGPVNLRTVVRSMLPTASGNESFKLRPEWKGKESYATYWYAGEMGALAKMMNEYARFDALGRAARMSFAVGRTEDARRFATDLMALNEKYSRGDPEKLNGDAVHDGNLVLGRIALDEGRVEEAKRHLLAAGKTLGSPVLGSFGPSMCL